MSNFMKFCDFFESPERALAFIAVIAAIGLVSFGVTGFFVAAKSATILDKVVSVLADVLVGAAGAKAGLSMASRKPLPPSTDDKDIGV